MHIITIIGARPQFIKAAALSHSFLQSSIIRETIIHTGQHFDANMSDVFFIELGIPKPKYHLNINSVGHGAMTGRMLEGIEAILLEEKPDVVLVYGDTNSTLAGAIAAAKLHIPIAHVEAGLRSFNMCMPEEINRILTDRISTWLFCPTSSAIQHAKAEGISDSTLHLVGDVMYDAVNVFSKLTPSIQLQNVPSKFALLTLHRAENTDSVDRFSEIIAGLNRVAADIPIVFPVHPRTRSIISRYDLHPNILLIEPLGYIEMLKHLQECALVLTDSGGLQKEAYFNLKPCVTLREETEWTELVEIGANTLCKADAEIIYTTAKQALSSQVQFQPNLYGGGKACENIVQILENSMHSF